MKNLAIVAAICLAPACAVAGENGPVASWSGFYVGGDAGAALDNNRTNYSYAYLPGNGTGNFSDAFGNAADNAAGSAANGPLNVGGLNAVQSAESQGIIPAYLGKSANTDFAGGGHIGFNWQDDEIVFGSEADMQGFSQNGAIHFTGTIPGFTNSGFSRTNVQWMGTARLRVGYAFDQSLLYATGGLAFGGISAASGSIGTDGSTTDTFAGGVSATHTGWTAGGGYEFALGDDWSTRIEALYYDLGTATYTVAPQDAGSAAEGLTVNARHHFDGTLIRIGISRWL